MAARLRLALTDTDTLLATSCVLLQHTHAQDSIWMANRPIVGPKAFAAFVQQMRTAYPDLTYDVGQVRGVVAK